MKVCPACRADYGRGEVFCPVDATRLVTVSQIGASPLDPEDPLIGSVLAGKYVVEQRIGEGGMGLVYEGRHRDLDKRIAIKVLRDDLSRRPEVVARFRQEARSASKIGHEHIVDVSDFGETARGASYFVMEFLEGEDLADVLGRELTLDPDRASHIVLQCCQALGAAHALGIVHRDIKPENIFLTRREGADDFVKLVDFGIAKMSDIETDGAPGRKLTKTGMIFGTPEYMSPEQAAGRELDHRVDVYALGIILYECLAGQVPYEGDTFMGVLTQHLFSDLPPIRSLNPQARHSDELDLVIRKALAKDPDERYQDTEQLAEAIECALQGRLSRVTQMSPPAVVSTSSLRYLDPVPRRRTPRWMVVASFLGAIAAMGWWLGSGAGQHRGVPSTDAATDPPTTTAAAHDGTERADPSGGPVTDAPRDEAKHVDSGFVYVHVASQPAGAALDFGDGSRACDATPCTLRATPGAKLVLRARLGKRQGRVALTPHEEQTVLIELTSSKKAKPKRRVSGPSRRPSRDPARDVATRGSDLKVPEWAQ